MPKFDDQLPQRPGIEIGGAPPRSDLRRRKIIVFGDTPSSVAARVISRVRNRMVRLQPEASSDWTHRRSSQACKRENLARDALAVAG
jgi:hypothetical protein